jgi:hypothetical protein
MNSIPKASLHSTNIRSVQPVIAAAEAAIKDEIQSVSKLSAIASDYPYYKSVLEPQLWDAAHNFTGIIACGLEMSKMSSLQFYYVDGWEVCP